jgi:hypothetical protein
MMVGIGRGHNSPARHVIHVVLVSIASHELLDHLHRKQGPLAKQRQITHIGPQCVQTPLTQGNGFAIDVDEATSQVYVAKFQARQFLRTDTLVEQFHKRPAHSARVTLGDGKQKPPYLLPTQYPHVLLHQIIHLTPP